MTVPAAPAAPASAPPASPAPLQPARAPLPPAALPPLSLYVHFPWCVRKCPYCDFNSHTLHGPLPEAEYIEALLADLEAQLPAAQGRELGSIFLGGGTPSLISARALERLLTGVSDRCALAADVEVTLEANPGALERGCFADYRAAGVNRVSLGAQSFSDESLRRLGRIHAAADTRHAVEALQRAGLTNFNLDLIYGLPGQTPAGALEDIDSALALGPPHLSHYQLSLEPGTVFGARPPADLPDSDCAAQMLDLCQERLATAGLQRYEVSAYARHEARSRHNLNYWRFGDYLGIGAGAHGKCTRTAAGTLVIERRSQTRDPRRYLRLGPLGTLHSHVVPPGELPFEFMLNALRILEGFTEPQFERRTGLPFAAVRERLRQGRQRGLLEQVGERWRASARGLDWLNELLAAFLEDSYAQRQIGISTN